MGAPHSEASTAKHGEGRTCGRRVVRWLAHKRSESRATCAAAVRGDPAGLRVTGAVRGVVGGAARPRENNNKDS